MSGSFALDTNVVIALLKGEPAIQERLSQAEAILVPSIVIGELYFGARKSTRVAENVARIDRFVASVAVIGVDVEVARHYGTVKSALRKAGRPIPENDIWVAATAIRHDLTLVTRDGHFEAIDSLTHVPW